VTRKFHANRQVGAAFDQKLGYQQSPVAVLRDCVEYRGLPADTGAFQCRADVYSAPRSRSRIAAPTRPVNECRLQILFVRAAKLRSVNNTIPETTYALGTLKGFPPRWME